MAAAEGAFAEVPVLWFCMDEETIHSMRSVSSAMCRACPFDLSEADRVDMLRHAFPLEFVLPYFDDAESETCLARVSEEGDEDAVRVFVENMCYVELPLANACEHGHLGIVKYLIEEQAFPLCDIDPDDDGLHLACIFGHLDVVKCLVENGAGTHTDVGEFIVYAASSGHVDIIDYLHSKGFNVPACATEASIKAARSGHVKTVAYLFRNYNLSVVSVGHKLLCVGASHGHLDVVQYMILIGAPVSDNGRYHPLHFASHGPYPDIIHCLLPHGADRHTLELSAMPFCRDGNVEMLKCFADHGLDFSSVGGALVGEAAAFANVAVIDFLFANGVSSHALQDSAIPEAARSGQEYIVKYLVEDYNLTVHSRNEKALRLAAAHGHVGTIEYILSQGADVHAYHDQALQIAAEYGNTDAVECLVRWGADVCANGSKALLEADEVGHRDVVEYLVSQGARHKMC